MIVPEDRFFFFHAKKDIAMKRSSQKSRREQLTRGRLAVQRLESRKLMAADIGIADATLSIQGTDSDDAV